MTSLERRHQHQFGLVTSGQCDQSRARKIKNKPMLTIDPQAAELVTLRQQVFEVFFSLEIVKKIK